MTKKQPVVVQPKSKAVLVEPQAVPKSADLKPVDSTDILTQFPEARPADISTTGTDGAGKVVPVREHDVVQETEDPPLMVSIAVGSGIVDYKWALDRMLDGAYAPDDNFNAEATINEYMDKGWSDLTHEERLRLGKARSKAEFDMLLNRVADLRIQGQVTADSPVATTLGAFVDPLNFVGGVGLASKAKNGEKLYSLAERAVVAAGVGAQVGAATHAAFDDTKLSQNVAMAIGFNSLFNPSIKLKGSAGVANAVERGAPVHQTPETVIDSATVTATIKPRTVAEEVDYELQVAGIKAERQVNSERILSDYQKAYKERTGADPNMADPAVEKEYARYRKTALERYRRREQKALAKLEAEQAVRLADEPDVKITTDDADVSLKFKEIDRTKITPTAYAVTSAGIFGDKILKYLSSADEVRHMANFADEQGVRDLLDDQLLYNHRNRDNVIANANVISRRGEKALVDLDAAMAKVAREYYGGASAWQPFYTKQHRDALNRVQADTQRTLLRLQQAEQEARLKGFQFDLNQAILDFAPNDGIRRITKQYVESGFAKWHLDNAKAAGLRGADDVAQSSVYTPLKHDWESIRVALHTGQVTREALATMYGKHLYLRYGDDVFAALSIESKQTIEQRMRSLGYDFLTTLENNARSIREHGISGTSEGDLLNMLLHKGVALKDAERIVDQITHRSEEVGKVQNMKGRTRWDFDEQFNTGTGGLMSVMDFVDTNMMMNLDRYNRTMAHRTALAQKGIHSESALQGIFDNAIKNMSKEEAERYMRNAENYVNALLGRAIGESVPNWVKNMQAISAMLHLKNSGLYNVMDVMTTVHRVGLMNTLRGINRALRQPPMDADTANRVLKVFVDDNISNSRFRRIITHMDDNHVLGNDSLTFNIQQAAQTVKFLNGSEYVRRMNVRLIAGVYEATIEGAIKGSKADVAALKNLGVSDSLIQQIQKAGSLDKLDDAAMFELERSFMTTTDELAMFAHYGEAPSFIETSTVGRVILPYMRYAMAANQKVLRSNYHRGGGMAVATLLAHQLPMALLLAKARMVAAGKDSEDYESSELYSTALGALTSGGYLSAGLAQALQGGFNSTSTALAPVTSLGRFVNEVSSDDPDLYQASRNVPLFGISLMHSALGALQVLGDE